MLVPLNRVRHRTSTAELGSGPTVAVAVTTCFQAHFLREALRSVLNQRRLATKSS
jgi:hypothetical protein